jgi:predicted SAM-dependent methyltransferase
VGATALFLIDLMNLSIEQHNREIHQNIERWNGKPLLWRIYGEFYREIAARVKPIPSGLVVELGSGMGKIKEYVPDCITTDVFPNPWLDAVENAYALTFRDASIGHLILFDVWHHLEFPGTALREFYRVLQPGGRLIIFDPAMGLLGRIVFGLFHHEPLALHDPITWEAPNSFVPSSHRYYAAQGNASRIFSGQTFRQQLKDWHLSEVRHFSALAYLASGGLRGPQLYPEALLPVLQAMDRVLSRFSFLASRNLVVLEKQCNRGHEQSVFSNW